MHLPELWQLFGSRFQLIYATLQAERVYDGCAKRVFRLILAYRRRTRRDHRKASVCSTARLSWPVASCFVSIEREMAAMIIGTAETNSSNAGNAVKSTFFATGHLGTTSADAK